MTPSKSTATYRSPEHREKISQGRIRAWQRYYESIGQSLPTTKKCNACGKIKRVDPDPGLSEFPLQTKRRNKSGVEYVAPGPECRACSAKRAARNRARFTKKEMRKKRKAWNSRRDPEKTRNYHREYSRMRRERDGVPANGGWKQYRKLEEDVRVDLAPCLDWLRDWLKWYGGNREFERITGISEKTVRRWLSGEITSTQLSVLDGVFTKLGHPEMPTLFWPL